MLEPFGTEPNWPFLENQRFSSQSEFAIHFDTATRNRKRPNRIGNWKPSPGGTRTRAANHQNETGPTAKKKPNAEQISKHRGLISIDKKSRRDRHDGHRFSNSYVSGLLHMFSFLFHLLIFPAEPEPAYAGTIWNRTELARLLLLLRHVRQSVAIPEF